MPYLCRSCQRRYSSLRTLNQHLSTRHPREDVSQISGGTRIRYVLDEKDCLPANKKPNMSRKSPERNPTPPMNDASLLALLRRDPDMLQRQQSLQEKDTSTKPAPPAAIDHPSTSKAAPVDTGVTEKADEELSVSPTKPTTKGGPKKRKKKKTRFESTDIEDKSERKKTKDEAKRKDMYTEMQQLISDDNGYVLPVFANYVFGTSDKIGHGRMAASWDLDGVRCLERWWFA